VSDSGFGSGAAHDPAVFIFAGGFFVEDTLFDHESTGDIPEVEMKNLTLAGEEVVLDAEALHGLEVAAKDGCGDEIGYLGDVVVAGFKRVEGVESNLFANGDLAGVRGVPLRDAGVEIPTVEVDALIGLEEFGEKFSRGEEVFSFEMDETYDHVGDLNAGVVDVILDAYVVAGFVAVVAEEALKGVAEDGIAEVADVGGFIGVDAGVFDETETGAADFGVLVGCDTAERGGAVEAYVEIACSSDFHARDSFRELR
jgi:hypothetical protein